MSQTQLSPELVSSYELEGYTIHQRINFKSHYPVKSLPRVKRVSLYAFQAESNSNGKSFDIPYWEELQGNRFIANSTFRNKF